MSMTGGGFGRMDLARSFSDGTQCGFEFLDRCLSEEWVDDDLVSVVSGRTMQQMHHFGYQASEAVAGLERGCSSDNNPEGPNNHLSAPATTLLRRGITQSLEYTLDHSGVYAVSFSNLWQLMGEDYGDLKNNVGALLFTRCSAPKTQDSPCDSLLLTQCDFPTLLILTPLMTAMATRQSPHSSNLSHYLESRMLSSGTLS